MQQICGSSLLVEVNGIFLVKSLTQGIVRQYGLGVNVLASI